MNRRRFLAVLGGGTIVAATGVGAWLGTRTPALALEPWSLAGSAYDEPRRRALSYALLAPNPHNLQPWRVALDEPDIVTLFADGSLALPHTDPFDRQLTIGLGCFLELMRMAAAADGYAVEIEPFPEGWSAEGLDQRPIARATFAKAEAETDPLFAHVLERRSNKEPFDTERAVDAASLAAMVEAARTISAGGSVEADDVAFWRALTAQAIEIEARTPRTHKESVDLFRIGRAEIEANPDGIDLGGPFLEGLSKVGLLSREGVADPASAQFQQGLDATLGPARSSMGHVWLVSKDNERPTQLAVGADWLRMNLAATAQGLGFQPHSQALQEYAEMEDLYARTHARLAGEGGTVQMLARIGHGPEVAPAPRWRLERRMM